MVDEVDSVLLAALVHVGAHLCDAGSSSGDWLATRATAEIHTARRPRPVRERAHLVRRDLEEAVRHHLEDGGQVALHRMRLRGHDLDLHRRVLRLVGAVDPVAVQDEPERLLVRSRDGRQDLSGEAGRSHLQAALALRATNQHAGGRVGGTEVDTPLAVLYYSLERRELVEAGSGV